MKERIYAYLLTHKSRFFVLCWVVLKITSDAVLSSNLRKSVMVVGLLSISYGNYIKSNSELNYKNKSERFWNS